MNNANHYQKKREKEKLNIPKAPKAPIDEFKILAVSAIIGILIVIVLLFVMLANALDQGRKDCESMGGEFHSTTSGKLVITSCEKFENKNN